ncbi:MAG: hypothetical protein ACOY93_16380 [Bacillota bacterium]
MKLGLELLARRPVQLRLGTFFETWIATAGGSVRRSLGRDEYHLSLTIGAGSRLAATGRTHICQVDLEAAELGTNGARPCLLAEAEFKADGPVIWGVRTNLFLDLPDLTRSATARLLTEGAPPLLFGLDDQRVVAEAVAPGRYILDVTGLLSP